MDKEKKKQSAVRKQFSHFFRTRHDTLPFSQKKEKSHSQSGFSDCPWLFSNSCVMSVFALCFRYNGNCDPLF